MPLITFYFIHSVYNIKIGKSPVQDAAKEANAHNFILGFPDGMYTDHRVREAAKKNNGLFLVARPLRGGGGVKGLATRKKDPFLML